MADFCVTGLGVGDAARWAGAAFFLVAATTRLATGFALARAGFLAVRRASDVASLASASAKALLASSKSALAFLACFLARLAMSLTSLRLRLAIRACSFAAFHRLSAVATRRRAI